MKIICYTIAISFFIFTILWVGLQIIGAIGL